MGNSTQQNEAKGGTPLAVPTGSVSPCAMTTTCGKCGNNRCPVKALDIQDIVEMEACLQSGGLIKPNK